MRAHRNEGVECITPNRFCLSCFVIGSFQGKASIPNAPKRPFHDPRDVISRSQMAVRELDDDNDNDKLPLGTKLLRISTH